MPGDDCSTYIRRLALANHMRPAHLRRYLQNPSDSKELRLDWLAILSGRSQTALRYALADLRADSVEQIRPSRRSRPTLPREELFRLIRGDARRGLSINALADRYGVGGRTVVAAIASPNPKPRKQYPLRPSRLDPLRPILDAMIDAETATAPLRRGTIRHIYDCLVCDHGAAISYGMVRDYVAHRRRTSSPRDLPRSHQAVENYNLAALRDLLDDGESPNDIANGKPLLHRAIDAEHARHAAGDNLHADITTLLLVRGADLQLRAHNTVTALEHAEQLGHWLAIEILQAWPPATTQPTQLAMVHAV
jgi:hypothetical protein